MFKIVRLKNKLKSNLKNIHLNVVFAERIVAEIQIKYGKKSCDYYANHFLYELARADSID